VGSEQFDAFLLVSFGGPEGMDDVVPFLENVLRGKNVPAERMKAVAQHYKLFDGVSPINEQNRILIKALKPIIEDGGPGLPIYWGNRNWHPFLADTVQQMADDGIKRALAFVTAAYSSYSSCRQYQQNITEAQSKVGAKAPQIEKIRPFYNHPGFIEANADHLARSLKTIPGKRQWEAALAFTAHSIPCAMARGCDYQTQLLETCNLIIDRLQYLGPWQLVYQSRSGAPNQEWLEPDILDHVKRLASQAVSDLIIHPVGFLCDHMEVLYDLDTQAKELGTACGISVTRSPTVGTHPRFLEMIRELVEERTNPSPVRQAIGKYGPADDLCASHCCPIATLQ
jgi:ferrochelatase